MQNIEEIYIEYSTTVYKYLFCLTQNKEISEDLTQETFALEIKDINKFRGECKLSVWLCQITLYNILKQKKMKQLDIRIEIY